ncbi:cytochrome b [Pelagibius sp. Alg239-R121]|uniref:cytochrome b n=1 Tax=Pelagibius sp. Alg239-R121 TaxID=2993448 RepID=UPI0024A6E15D|nr:cytochrome b/b6 domain-containing protein [Pelagibius sp. Alg239-R121]
MERYVLSARVLHWVMAAGFIFMWACGYAMTSLVSDDSPLQEFLFGLHISIGVTLLLLLVIRIAVRTSNSPPPLPKAMARWEVIGSHLGHLGLYLLPAAVILIGWAETDFGGHGVKWFGLSMPKIFPTMKSLWGQDLETATSTLHEWLAYAMLALAAVHVAAVIKHRWIDGHDVLKRMTF